MYAFDFLHFCNQHQEINLLHITIRKQMKRKIEKHRFNKFVTRSNQFVFFAIVCRRRQWFSVSEFAINQNASINKNSKSSNSMSLKQHTFAKSILFCCFCFCFVRNIDRFIILICKYFSSRSKSRFSTRFSTRFSFSQFSHIFSVFVFAFSVFAFIFSRLSHSFWIFLLLSWSDWYLNYN